MAGPGGSGQGGARRGRGETKRKDGKGIATQQKTQSGRKRKESGEDAREKAVKTILFDPGRATKMAVEAAEKMGRDIERAVRLGSLGKEFDGYFNPMYPGDLLTVIALTGNGKSSLCQFAARSVAEQLRKQDRLDESVIYVTWEQTIEFMTLLDIGRETGHKISDFARGLVKEWDKVRSAAMRVAQVPIYRMGYNMANRREMIRIRLTLPTVSEALYLLDEWNRIKPALICLDYLQAMDTEGKREQRRMDIDENVHAAKNLAFDLGCPVIMASQAKQTLMDRKTKLPQRYDAKESGTIAERSDAILGLWMPKTSETTGDFVEIARSKYVVDANLLLLNVAKQKWGEDGRHFAFHIKPGTNEIAPLEKHREIEAGGERSW